MNSLKKSTFDEVLKCKSDPIHFIQTHVVDFKLDERQIGYLKELASGEDCKSDGTISDIQVLNLAFALWKMLVNPFMSVVFMSKDKSERERLAQKFKEMMDRITLFEIKLTRNLKYEISLFNNSTIFFGDYSSFECQLHGRSMSILILDDFKTFEDKYEFMRYVFPVVKSYKDSQIIGI